MGGALPYLGAVCAEHVGPAARSLRFALLEPPGLGALSSVRRANVRSRSEIRKFASEGKNKRGTTIRRPSLTLLGPVLMNFRARVSHHHSPCRAAVRTCRAAMELMCTAIRTGCIPPSVMISAPGFLVGNGMDTPLRGFLHAEPRARLHKMAHAGRLILRFRGGDRERSSTRR